MPSRRNMRSASRKNTPSSPPTTRSAAQSPRQVRQSAKSHRGEPVGQPSTQQSRKGKLQPVGEETGDEIIVSQHENHDSDQPDVDDEHSDASSYSSTGSDIFEALDRDLMIDGLVSIDSDADNILSMMRYGTIDALAKSLNNPTSTTSKRFRNFARRLENNLSHFQRRLLLQVEINVRKLCKVSRHADLPSIPLGKWRPDSVLKKANLAVWLVYLLEGQSDTTHNEQLEMLQYLATIDIFPSPFGTTEPDFEEQTLQLWLSLLTQWYIMSVAERRKNQLSFDRDEVLNQAFLDEDSNPRLVAGSNEDSVENAENQLAQRMAEIRKHFSSTQGKQVNMAALQRRFPWNSFLDEVASWIDQQKNSLDRDIGAAKSVRDIALQLGSPDFKPELEIPIAKRTARKSTNSHEPDFGRLIDKDRQRSEKLRAALQSSPSRQRHTEATSGDRILRDITRSFTPRAKEVEQTPQPEDAGEEVAQDQLPPRSAQYEDNDEIMAADEIEDDIEDERDVAQGTLIPTQQTREVLKQTERQRLESNKENKGQKRRLVDAQDGGKKLRWDSPDNSPAQSKRRKPSPAIEEEGSEEYDDFEVDSRPQNSGRAVVGKQNAQSERSLQRNRDASPFFEGEDEQLRTDSPTRHRQALGGRSSARNIAGSSTRVRANALPTAINPESDQEYQPSDEPTDHPISSQQYVAIKAQAKSNVQWSRAFNPSMRSRAGLTQNRRAWSSDEIEALMEGVALHGCKWALILAEDAGSEEPRLQGRTNVQLKDKARNMKLDFLKAERELPENFIHVTISKDHKRQLDELGIRYPENNFERQTQE